MGRATRKLYKSTVGVLNTYGRRKMAGEVFSFAGSTPPAGSLLCNGALISRTAYANLFAAIGIVYGAGDGNTTFALPDYRGEFPRFADLGRGVDLGRSLGSAQAGQNERHSHNPCVLKYPNKDIAVAGTDSKIGTPDPLTSSMPGLIAFQNTAYGQSLGYTERAELKPAGQQNMTDNGGNETRPRNVAVLPCIYY
jgi:microcystin-dependent protein